MSQYVTYSSLYGEQKTGIYRGKSEGKRIEINEYDLKISGLIQQLKEKKEELVRSQNRNTELKNILIPMRKKLLIHYNRNLYTWLQNELREEGVVDLIRELVGE